MLATRCTIELEETMHAYDDARHEPPYPPPDDDRVYLGNPLEPAEDAATKRSDRKLEFVVDDFHVTVAAKHVRQEPWEKFVTALTRLLVDPH